MKVKKMITLSDREVIELIMSTDDGCKVLAYLVKANYSNNEARIRNSIYYGLKSKGIVADINTFDSNKFNVFLSEVEEIIEKKEETIDKVDLSEILITRIDFSVLGFNALRFDLKITNLKELEDYLVAEHNKSGEDAENCLKRGKVSLFGKKSFQELIALLRKHKLQINPDGRIIPIEKDPTLNWHKIKDIDMTVRSSNLLKSSNFLAKEGFTFLEELQQYSKEDLMRIRNMGEKSVIEINNLMKEKKLSLRQE
ncbi:MAG: DNA-directed RNA polymerase subunit alpha C-terminal domain-containing protein [Candidatus Paceibacterota bacterium]|jgi:DNA-directed RNA polymerase alpha subunit